MKLYLIPSACSLAAHIAVREADLAVDLIKVDLATKMLPDGSDYASITPKGQVSAMTLDNGELLTENIAVLVYLSSLAPHHALMPDHGTPAYFRTLEWLTFVATEIHKQIFWTTFSPAAPDTYKNYVRSLLPDRFKAVEDQLNGREFISAPHFTVADAYFTWALHMVGLLNVDLAEWPTLQAYQHRMFARNSVIQALSFEAS